MKARTAIGVVMMLSSAVFFAGGVYVIVSALDMQERQAREQAATDRQCVELINTLPSVTVTQSGADLVAVMRDVKDPRKALSDATVAAMMCPGRKLVEVCLGDKCAGAKDTTVLSFKLEGEK